MDILFWASVSSAAVGFVVGCGVGYRACNERWWQRILDNEGGISDRISEYASGRPISKPFKSG